MKMEKVSSTLKNFNGLVRRAEACLEPLSSRLRLKRQEETKNKKQEAQAQSLNIAELTSYW